MAIEIFDNLSFYNRSKLLDLANRIVTYYIANNLVNKNEDNSFSVHFENDNRLKLWTYHKSNNIDVRIIFRHEEYFKSFEKVSEFVEWLLLKAMQ